MALHLPKQALGPAGTMMLGSTMAATTLGMAVATIAAFSFFCRNCGRRGKVPREQYDGKCPNCGEGIRKKYVKRSRMLMPSAPNEPNEPVQGPPPAADDPVQILKIRLAKGEITPEEYQKIVNVLKETPQ